MSSAGNKGLGRGLSALIPQAADREHQTLDARDRLFHDIVHAGLDLLEELAPSSLCAYLHLPHESPPQLMLRSPALESLTASIAYRLFVGLAAVADEGEPHGSFTIEGVPGWFHRTSGPASDGVHFLTLSDPHVAGELAIETAFADTAEAFGSVCHQFPVAGARDLPEPRLVVEVASGTTSVHVSFDRNGSTASGRGAAEDPQEAVARAVLDACRSPHDFASITDVEVDEARAVLVAVEPAAGMVRLGIAITDEGLLQAAALATLRALDTA